MSLNQPIRELEKAKSIPEGTAYVATMGDGSGTKAVTQETLVEETGKALKVGDLTKLQTENKESLVAAINEAAQSGGTGGGTSIDILDSKEEIEANTEAEKVAGALAVKEMIGELNDNLGGFSFGVTEDGKPGFRKPGADAVTPFKRSTALYLGEVEWTHYGGKSNTYDFSQKIRDAGLDPNDFTSENIFFRPKTTAYKSYTNATQTVERGYTYSNGVVTTTSGNVGSMYALNVVSLCYLVI